MRYFIEFSYKGTRYHGWQMQPNAATVQQVLTEALQTILREKIELVGAGRTDAGVHAQTMYAHFDTGQAFSMEILVSKLNSYLPADIAVQAFHEVADEAHARFDATSRTYEYHIHTYKNVFNEELSWYHHKVLDINAMNAAAQILLQYTDFECFSKTHTDVFTFDCEIKEAYWKDLHGHYVFTITANRFLRNMVRAIVGTLVNVGLGKIEIEALHGIIQSKNRGKAGFSVPAQGLFLTKVTYPYL